MTRVRRFAPKALQATFILSALFAITVRSAPSRAITAWRMDPSRASLLGAPLPEGIALRAGSWNVYGGSFTDAATVGAALGALQLDVVALQEVPHAVFAEDVARAMGPAYTSYFGGGKALVSRTPLAGAETVNLVNGRGFVRATTVVEGVPFSLYGAHLGWDLEGNRQNREFMDDWVLPDPNAYLLVMGDFNDEHLSTQIDILEEDLVDVWTKLGLYPGERISWPATRFDGDEGSQLIDNVFVRRAAGAIVLQGDVVNLSPALSDHKPVWADLLFSPDPEAPFTEDPFAEARRPGAGFPESPPENLLVNPGFEEGFLGWKFQDGMLPVQARESQVARGGEWFATGPGCLAPAQSKAVQAVRLDDRAAEIDAGRGRLWAHGWMTTAFYQLAEGGILSNWVRPYDEAEIRVELYDGDDALVGVETSRRRDTLRWWPYYGGVDLPPGTRWAKFVVTSYFKYLSLLSSDGAFDDLYLGYETLPAPHGVLGPNLLANADARAGSTAGWEADPGFVVRRDADFALYCCGFFPWHSASGSHLFTSPVDAGVREMAQIADLAPYADAVAANALSLRWGGTIRSLEGLRDVSLALEFLGAGDASLGEATLGPIRAAEWLPYERTDPVPVGTERVRFVARAEGAAGDRGFYDLLTLVPVAR